MNKQSSYDKDKQPVHPIKPNKEDVKLQQQQEEQKEVVGRHKNEGRDDHKGHKESR